MRAENKPRIVLAGPLPPPIGGMEHVVRQLSIASILAADFTILPLNTTPLPMLLRRPRLAKEASAAWVRQRLRRILRETRPTLVHLHTPWGGEFWRARSYAQVAHQTGVPVLLHLHSGALLDWLEGMPVRRQNVACEFLSSVTHIVVLAPSWRTKLVPWTGNTPISVIPNGLDLDVLGPVREHPTHPGPFRLLTVGRLERAKGTLEVLEAAQLLPSSDYEFTLVGRIADPEVRRKLREMRSSSNLRILGELANSQVIEEYARADAFLFMSHAEGLGVALLEAMAMGLPAITSGMGGIADILRHGPENPVVPVGDPEALAAAISNLAQDTFRHRTLGAENAIYARRQYPQNRLFNSLAELYSSMIAA